MIDGCEDKKFLIFCSNLQLYSLLQYRKDLQLVWTSLKPYYSRVRDKSNKFVPNWGLLAVVTTQTQIGIKAHSNNVQQKDAVWKNRTFPISAVMQPSYAPAHIKHMSCESSFNAGITTSRM